MALEQDPAARDLARVVDQAHDAQGGHALAAAGLAHQPQGLALGDRKRDAVHRVHDALGRAELGVQVVNPE